MEQSDPVATGSCTCGKNLKQAIFFLKQHLIQADSIITKYKLKESNAAQLNEELENSKNVISCQERELAKYEKQLAENIQLYESVKKANEQMEKDVNTYQEKLRDQECVSSGLKTHVKQYEILYNKLKEESEVLKKELKKSNQQRNLKHTLCEKKYLNKQESFKTLSSISDKRKKVLHELKKTFSKNGAKKKTEVKLLQVALKLENFESEIINIEREKSFYVHALAETKVKDKTSLENLLLDDNISDSDDEDNSDNAANCSFEVSPAKSCHLFASPDKFKIKEETCFRNCEKSDPLDKDKEMTPSKRKNHHKLSRKSQSEKVSSIDTSETEEEHNQSKVKEDAGIKDSQHAPSEEDCHLHSGETSHTLDKDMKTTSTNMKNCQKLYEKTDEVRDFNIDTFPAEEEFPNLPEEMEDLSFGNSPDTPYEENKSFKDINKTDPLDEDKETASSMRENCQTLSEKSDYEIDLNIDTVSTSEVMEDVDPLDKDEETTSSKMKKCWKLSEKSQSDKDFNINALTAAVDCNQSEVMVNKNIGYNQHTQSEENCNFQNGENPNPLDKDKEPISSKRKNCQKLSEKSKYDRDFNIDTSRHSQHTSSTENWRSDKNEQSVCDLISFINSKVGLSSIIKTPLSPLPPSPPHHVKKLSGKVFDLFPDTAPVTDYDCNLEPFATSALVTSSQHFRDDFYLTGDISDYSEHRKLSHQLSEGFEPRINSSEVDGSLHDPDSFEERHLNSTCEDIDNEASGNFKGFITFDPFENSQTLSFKVPTDPRRKSVVQFEFDSKRGTGNVKYKENSVQTSNNLELMPFRDNEFRSNNLHRSCPGYTQNRNKSNIMKGKLRVGPPFQNDDIMEIDHSTPHGSNVMEDCLRQTSDRYKVSSKCNKLVSKSGSQKSLNSDSKNVSNKMLPPQSVERFTLSRQKRSSSQTCSSFPSDTCSQIKKAKLVASQTSAYLGRDDEIQDDTPIQVHEKELRKPLFKKQGKLFSGDKTLANNYSLSEDKSLSESSISALKSKLHDRELKKKKTLDDVINQPLTQLSVLKECDKPADVPVTLSVAEVVSETTEKPPTKLAPLAASVTELVQKKIPTGSPSFETEPSLLLKIRTPEKIHSDATCPLVADSTASEGDNFVQNDEIRASRPVPESEPSNDELNVSSSALSPLVPLISPVKSPFQKVIMISPIKSPEKIIKSKKGTKSESSKNESIDENFENKLKVRKRKRKKGESVCPANAPSDSATKITLLKTLEAKSVASSLIPLLKSCGSCSQGTTDVRKYPDCKPSLSYPTLVETPEHKLYHSMPRGRLYGHKKLQSFLDKITALFIKKNPPSEKEIANVISSITGSFCNPNFLQVQDIVQTLVIFANSVKDNPFCEYGSEQLSPPLLTSSDIVLLHSLETARRKRPGMENIYGYLITAFHSRITFMKREPNITGVSCLCRLLACMTKILEERNLMISICWDIFRYFSCWSPFLIASVVGVWPELLSEGLPEKDLLMYTFRYLLFHAPNTLDEAFSMQSREVLKEIGKLQPLPKHQTRDDVARRLLSEIKILGEKEALSDLEKGECFTCSQALRLLCDKENVSWAITFILDQLTWPIIDQWIEDRLCNTDVISCLLNLIGFVGELCPKEEKAKMEMFLQPLSALLEEDAKVPLEIQKLVFSALLRSFSPVALLNTPEISKWYSQCNTDELFKETAKMKHFLQPGMNLKSTLDETKSSAGDEVGVN